MSLHCCSGVGSYNETIFRFRDSTFTNACVKQYKCMLLILYFMIDAALVLNFI